jgi:hypothetical protein
MHSEREVQWLLRNHPVECRPTARQEFRAACRSASSRPSHLGNFPVPRCCPRTLRHRRGSHPSQSAPHSRSPNCMSNRYPQVHRTHRRLCLPGRLAHWNRSDTRLPRSRARPRVDTEARSDVAPPDNRCCRSSPSPRSKTSRPRPVENQPGSCGHSDSSRTVSGGRQPLPHGIKSSGQPATLSPPFSLQPRHPKLNAHVAAKHTKILVIPRWLSQRPELGE